MTRRRSSSLLLLLAVLLAGSAAAQSGSRPQLVVTRAEATAQADVLHSGSAS